MSEQIFWLQLDGQPYGLEPDNCGVALFRDEPEKDYLDIWRHDEEGNEAHTLLFHRREMLIWMGRVALTQEDERILRATEREYGPFRKQSGGFNPKVFVEDRATEWESELYVSSLLDDLNKADGLPIEFLE